MDVFCYCTLTKVQKDVGFLQPNGGNLESWTLQMSEWLLIKRHQLSNPCALSCLCISHCVVIRKSEAGWRGPGNWFLPHPSRGHSEPKCQVIFLLLFSLATSLAFLFIYSNSYTWKPNFALHQTKMRMNFFQVSFKPAQIPYWASAHSH